MIYLTAIGLPPGGSSTVQIYTKTIQRAMKNKQYVEKHRHLGRAFGRLFNVVESRGAQIFQTSISGLKIQGVRRVT
jgi:hypothetical protein